MKKNRLLCFVLCGLMVMNLVGCGKAKDEKEESIQTTVDESVSETQETNIVHTANGDMTSEDVRKLFEEETSENQDSTAEKEIHFEPLPEIINADLSSHLVQIGDMLFDLKIDGSINGSEDIYKTVTAITKSSNMDFYTADNFDDSGNPLLSHLMRDGEKSTVYLDYKDRVQLVYDPDCVLSEKIDKIVLRSIKFNRMSEEDQVIGMNYDNIYLGGGLAPYSKELTRDKLIDFLNEEGYVEKTISQPYTDGINHGDQIKFYVVWDDCSDQINYNIYSGYRCENEPNTIRFMIFSLVFDNDGKNITDDLVIDTGVSHL